jgi:hypothetical protein
VRRLAEGTTQRRKGRKDAGGGSARNPTARRQGTEKLCHRRPWRRIRPVAPRSVRRGSTREPRDAPAGPPAPRSGGHGFQSLEPVAAQGSNGRTRSSVGVCHCFSVPIPPMSIPAKGRASHGDSGDRETETPESNHWNPLPPNGPQVGRGRASTVVTASLSPLSLLCPLSPTPGLRLKLPAGRGRHAGRG